MKLFRHFFLLFIFSFSSLFAQEGFYYQAVIKNPDGSPLKETQVEVKISIVSNTTTLYTEQRSIDTSKEGFINFIIGENNPASFSGINWNQDLFLEDQIDINDGQGFSTPSRMPLLKSPRAYVADRAISVIDNSITTNSILNQTILDEDISDSAAISFSKLNISSSDVEGLGFVLAGQVDLTDDVTGVLPITNGGTGSATAPMIDVIKAADAAAARTVLGVDPAGTQVSTDVTLAGKDFLSITGQTITAGQVDLTDDVTGVLPITNGGTGSATAPMIDVIKAADAAAARTVLGVDPAGTQVSTDVTLAGKDFLSITGQTITAGQVDLTDDVTGVLPITNGGTGSATAPMIDVIKAADAAAARTVLGVDPAGTQVSTDVTLAGKDFLSITGQTITAGQVDLTDDVTGVLPITNGGTGSATAPMIDVIKAADAAAARTVLGVDPAGTQVSTDVTLAGKDFLSITGQTITAGQVDLTDDVTGVLPITNGGTGSATAPMIDVIKAADAAAARTVLGVDPAGTQVSTDVTLAGKDFLSITGQTITAGQVDLTDDVTGVLPITNGGTGSATAPMIDVIKAADAAAARTVLGVDPAGTQVSTDVTLAGKDFLSITGQTITAGQVDLTDDVTGVLPITNGGTGSATAPMIDVIKAADAAAARTVLGVDPAGTQVSTDVTLAGKDFLSITGQTITAGQVDLTDDVTGVLPITNGGTGSATAPMIDVIKAADAAAARTVLGVDPAGTQVSTDVTLAGKDFLSITGQTITAGQVDLTDDVTGVLPITNGGTGSATAPMIDVIKAADAAAARTVLGVDPAGTQVSTDVTLAGKDFLSITGQTITAGQVDLTDDVTGVLPITNGGTGSATAPMIDVIKAADAAAARTVLGVDPAGTQVSTDVTLAGKDFLSITGQTITAGQVDLTDDVTGVLPITNGGTGSATAPMIDVIKAADAAAARTVLGVDPAGTQVSTDVTLAGKDFLSITGQTITAGQVDLTDDVTGVLPITNGGTGSATAPMIDVIKAADAAAARTVLGVDPAGTQVSTDVTLAGKDFLSITGQTITAGQVDLTDDVTGVLPITNGGTGSATAPMIDVIKAADAAAARTVLGVDPAGTQVSTDVTLAGKDFLSITGQTITAGQVDLTDDVTGVLPITNGGTGSATAPMIDVIKAADAAAARTVLGVDPAGTQVSTDVTLAGKDFLSITGQTITAGQVDLTDDVTGVLPITNGGTGSATAPMIDVIKAADAAAARTVLGVDPAGTQVSTDVTLAGKDFLSITGQTITAGQVDLTDDVTGVLPITNGGTGSATAPMIDVIKAADAAAALDVLDIVRGSGTINDTTASVQINSTQYAGLENLVTDGAIVILTATSRTRSIGGDRPLKAAIVSESTIEISLSDGLAADGTITFNFLVIK